MTTLVWLRFFSRASPCENHSWLLDRDKWSVHLVCITLIMQQVRVLPNHTAIFLDNRRARIRGGLDRVSPSDLSFHIDPLPVVLTEGALLLLRSEDGLDWIVCGEPNIYGAAYPRQLLLLRRHLDKIDQLFVFWGTTVRENTTFFPICSLNKTTS